MKPIQRALLCAAVSSVFAPCVRAENIRITVLHTNDIHGYMMPRPDKEEKERMVGGGAVLASFVAKQRQGDVPVLLLDAGDWFVGTPEGTITRGALSADVFNAIEFDATVVGNHEYDFGEETLKGLISRMDTPVLGTNVYVKATGKPADYVLPYLIKEVAGVKIGIFGVNTSQMKRLNFPKNIAGLEFKDEVETARETAAKLKAEGADVLIVLSHAGCEGGKRHEENLRGDQTIAEEVPGIDLIVGGHTHTPIWNPEHTNGTLIVQAWSYLTHVGVVDLEIDPKTKKAVSSKGRLVKLWADEWGEDKEVKEIVKVYEERVGRQLDEVIGSSKQELVRSYKEEDQVGGWMTDCMRKWTKTDVTIQNGGGIRANVPAGDLRLRHMFELMPFSNYIVTMYLPGDALLGVLDRGVSGEIGMIEISGARLEYDPSAEKGKRVKKAWIGEEPLDLGKVYTVAAPDFIVEGGDDYDFTKGEDKAVHPAMIRDVLTWCVEKYSPVAGAPVGRLKKT